MPDLNEIKQKVAVMSGVALKMWQTTFAAFMEHDLDLISAALEEEGKLNQLEKEIIGNIVEFGRILGQEEDRNAALVYADVAADLEMIGDYCKDILERVAIKIEEKLLFSEDAVKEYSELYRISEEALREVVNALQKDAPGEVKAVLKKEEHIDILVDEYRRRHNQRLLQGTCSPLGCNMFLNMLDFTAAIYYHTKKIARNLLKL